MSRRGASAKLTSVGFVVLATFVATACGRETANGAGAVPVWTTDSVPALTLGLTGQGDTAITFERITGATRLPDGTLLVADLGDAPLTLFGADGTFLRRIARKGGGPGEMEYLAYLFRCGDQLYTYDIDGHRISEFSLDGTYRRSFRYQVPAGQQAPYVSACNARGQFGHLGWGAAPRVAGYHRDTVPVWVTETADGAPTLIDSVAASERWGQTYEGRLVGSMPLPLGRQPAVAFGPSAFYVTTGDSLSVRVYGLDGAQRAVYRVDGSVPPVAPADIRDFIETRIEERGESQRASIERDYGAVTFPTAHGAIKALIADSEGMLWLRSHAAATETMVRWRVLDSTGTEIAHADLPRRMDVFEIGSDYVLGREIDAEEGVPVLRLLRLNRTPAR